MSETPRPLYSKMTLYGHPIHPMLVGFPVTFYVSTLAGFIAFAATGDPFWYRVAYVANIAGVVTAFAAAIFGFTDWALGIPERTRAKRDGAIHMLLNGLAFLMFAVNLAVSAGGWGEAAPRVGYSVVFTLLGVLFTLGAGWFGWRMVQVHHAGVQIHAAGPERPSRLPIGETVHPRRT